jgi:hypothetical protein
MTEHEESVIEEARKWAKDCERTRFSQSLTAQMPLYEAVIVLEQVEAEEAAKADVPDLFFDMGLADRRMFADAEERHADIAAERGALSHYYGKESQLL